MLITNIFDYMYDADEKLLARKFHIPDIEYYHDIGMPFSIDPETDIILDNTGEPAILSVYLINNWNWEIIHDEENSNRPKNIRSSSKNGKGQGNG